MYKIDPKYFDEHYNFNFADRDANPTKFRGFSKEVVCGVTFYVGAAPVWDERLQKFEPEKNTFSFLSAEGVELCSITKMKFDDIRFQIKRREEDKDQYFRNQDRKYYIEQIERDKLSIFMHPVIENAAQNPEIVEHIPVEAFMARECLAEEILTQYQAQKLGELKKLPAGKDCSSFVEEIKTTVENMNKTFNNIEKTRQAKENFSDLFKRDREI